MRLRNAIPARRVGTGRGFRRRAALAALIVALAHPGVSWALGDPRYKISSGFEWTRGDYGDVEDTDILYAPLTMEVEASPWRVALTIPYIRIKGPDGVVGGTDSPILVDDGKPRMATHGGVGDVVAQATYMVPPLGGRLPFIDLTAKMKAPTASKKRGLGTGAFDWTFKTELFQVFGDWTLFADAGYRILGDSGDFRLRNGPLASIGAGYAVSDPVSVGFSLDYRARTTPAASPAVELVPYVDWTFRPDWKLNFYGVFGATDSSPNAGAGLVVSYCWGPATKSDSRPPRAGVLASAEP